MFKRDMINKRLILRRLTDEKERKSND